MGPTGNATSLFRSRFVAMSLQRWLRPAAAAPSPMADAQSPITDAQSPMPDEARDDDREPQHEGEASDHEEADQAVIMREHWTPVFEIGSRALALPSSLLSRPVDDRTFITIEPRNRAIANLMGFTQGCMDNKSTAALVELKKARNEAVKMAMITKRRESEGLNIKQKIISKGKGRCTK